MDIGATLRSARERQELSLDALSKTTKIGVPILQAIERNDFERLPAGIFLRGFLRAYAHEVGLDAETIVSRYVEQFEPTPVAAHEGHKDEGIEEPVSVDTRLLNEGLGRETTIQGAAVIVVLALGLLAYMTMREPQVTADPMVELAETGPVVLASLPVETRSTGVADRPVPAFQPGNLQVTIRTVGPCWVVATVDGRTVVYRLMQAGDTQTIEGGDDILLRVGDPATFTFLVNGIPGRSLGPAGRVATVRITADNYRDFVVPASAP